MGSDVPTPAWSHLIEHNVIMTMGDNARNLASLRRIIMAPMYSATFDADSCEIHIRLAGGAGPGILSQHRLGPKGIAMRL